MSSSVRSKRNRLQGVHDPILPVLNAQQPRNKRLLALKLNAGKTVQTLNGLKKKLQDAIREQDMISSEMKIKSANQKKTIESIKKTKDEISVAHYNNKK